MSEIIPENILVMIEPSGICVHRGLIQVRIDYTHEGCEPHGHFLYLTQDVSDAEIIAWALDHRAAVASAWSNGSTPQIANGRINWSNNLTPAEQAALENRAEQIRQIQIQ